MMAGAAGTGADVGALGARVVFIESSSQRWLLACKAKQATDAVWRPQHDGALLEALRALEALGRLPQGAPAKSDVSWEAAETQLRAIKAGLAASWAKCVRHQPPRLQPRIRRQRANTNSAACEVWRHRVVTAMRARCLLRMLRESIA